ncbi:Uncharacterised protein [Vibrio cholerae]|nr:Uncharacterised protein [Vibrio cholerae]
MTDILFLLDRLIGLRTARFQQLSMHMNNVLAAATFVQVINVLGNHSDTALQLFFQFAKSKVCRVRLNSVRE